MSKRFTTMSDIKKDKAPRDGDDSSGEDDEERKGQSFYVGGGEKSGQEVLGPPRRRLDDDDVGRIFARAREAGAEQVGPEEMEEDVDEQQPIGRTVFTGQGHRLGAESEKDKDVQVVGEYLSQEMGSGSTPKKKDSTTVKVHLNIWQNGFSINDGPLRSMQDPDSRQFMGFVQRGQIPPELTHANPGRVVDLLLRDRHHEEWKLPPVKPFSGEGHRLGAIVPGEECSSGVSTVPVKAVTKPQSSSTKIDNTSSAGAVGPPLKSGAPTTRLRIRLIDGRTLTGVFNHDHTLKDVRNWICECDDDSIYRPFLLYGTFPNRHLADEGHTLEQENLLGSVVVQKQDKQAMMNQ